ncbi:hypothetical protein ROZALSC1DRAFT_31085, partial [Rozella allomycis CSF55]
MGAFLPSVVRFAFKDNHINIYQYPFLKRVYEQHQKIDGIRILTAGKAKDNPFSALYKKVMNYQNLRKENIDSQILQLLKRQNAIDYKGHALENHRNTLRRTCLYSDRFVAVYDGKEVDSRIIPWYERKLIFSELKGAGLMITLDTNIIDKFCDKIFFKINVVTKEWPENFQCDYSVKLDCIKEFKAVYLARFSVSLKELPSFLVQISQTIVDIKDYQFYHFHKKRFIPLPIFTSSVTFPILDKNYHAIEWKSIRIELDYEFQTILDIISNKSFDFAKEEDKALHGENDLSRFIKNYRPGNLLNGEFQNCILDKWIESLKPLPSDLLNIDADQFNVEFRNKSKPKKLKVQNLINDDETPQPKIAQLEKRVQIETKSKK